MYFSSGTIQQWEDTAINTIDHCNENINKSQRLRESSQLVALQVDSDLKAQDDAVNFALRKRAHELARALEELKRQKQKVSSQLYFHVLTVRFPVKSVQF